MIITPVLGLFLRPWRWMVRCLLDSLSSSWFRGDFASLRSIVRMPAGTPFPPPIPPPWPTAPRTFMSFVLRFTPSQSSPLTFANYFSAFIADVLIRCLWHEQFLYWGLFERGSCLISPPQIYLPVTIGDVIVTCGSGSTHTCSYFSAGSKWQCPVHDGVACTGPRLVSVDGVCCQLDSTPCPSPPSPPTSAINPPNPNPASPNLPSSPQPNPNPSSEPDTSPSALVTPSQMSLSYVCHALVAFLLISLCYGFWIRVQRIESGINSSSLTMQK